MATDLATFDHYARIGAREYHKAHHPRTLRYSEQLDLAYDGAYWRVMDRETGSQLGTATRKREEAEMIADRRIRSEDYK
jgi:hypothetical protein